MPIEQEEIDRHVGSKLREFRESKGLSVPQLAEKVGRDVNLVKENEDGSRRISADELWQLCALFDVKPSSFFQGLD